MVPHHPAKVEDGIAHASQRGVDAHPCGLSDFLERHFLIKPHVAHLALRGRQHVHQFAHVAQHLIVDEVVLHIHIKEFAVQVRQVIALGGFHYPLRALFPVPVHDDVVGDSDKPCAELAGIGVFPLLQFGDDLDERLLEDVIRHIRVAHDKHNISKQLVCQKYIFKIHSSRLRKAKWDLTLPINEARRNDEVISLADSQVLRWIDELNGITDADEQAHAIKNRIKAIRQEKNSPANKKLIKQLYDKLDTLQFKPDYMCLIIYLFQVLYKGVDLIEETVIYFTT